MHQKTRLDAGTRLGERKAERWFYFSWGVPCGQGESASCVDFCLVCLLRQFPWPVMGCCLWQQMPGRAGYLGGDFQYCILGSPNKNQLYEFSKIMEYLNQYARFGVFNGDAVCTRRSWQGVFHYLCGIDLELCPPSEYGVVMENPVVQNMPLFPDEGSILQVDDKIVIKISE